MNKLYTLALFLVGFAGISQAQLNCGDTYTDSGGSEGTYQIDENDTVTVCPTIPGQVVIANFTSFNTEANWDSLTIYNGNSAMDMMIGTYDGMLSPGMVFSTNPNGCLTFVWASDGSVVRDGWEAMITCDDPITCFAPDSLMFVSSTLNSATIGWLTTGTETQWMVEYGPVGFEPGTGTEVAAMSNPFTINGLAASSAFDYYVRSVCSASDTSFMAGPMTFVTQIAPFVCGNQFVDNGGGLSYSNTSNDTITICPSIAGQVVLLDFSSFLTEDGYDSLVIFNGNTTSDEVIGTYMGELNPFVVYSTNPNGCLTALFLSDGSVTETGWTASIDCVAPITCMMVENLMVDTTYVNSATLSWTSNGTETSWIVEYGPSGFEEGTGTTQVAATNPFTISGLTATTAYEFYVRAYCGGTDTSFVTGPQMFSTQNDAFICGNVFADDGAFMNYALNVDDTITICPNGNFEFVEVVFTSFETENGYDSLMIYNGNSTAATQIGTYQGTNSPGTVTSTSPDGCLTFVFHSDEIFAYPGWIAQINCYYSVGLNQNDKELVSVYPNPSTGKFTIENLDGANLSYQVLDAQGRNMQIKVTPEAGQKEIDLSSFENGVYFLVVSDGTSTKTYSLVKN